MRSRLRMVALSVLALATVLSAGTALAIRLRQTPSPGRLATLGKVPAFSMHDQTDRVVTDESLRGQVLIVDFFYASCTTSCPRLTAQMASFQREVAERGRSLGKPLPVHLVSITLDPINDTPAALAEYAARFAATPASWSFLSGRSDDLNRVVVGGFKLHFQRDEASLGLATIMHGEWFVLVDAAGEIRGYYQIGDRGRMAELLRDAESLALNVGAQS